MPFRLLRDTKTWFKDIKFELDFDMYYFCLMAGLATRTKEDKPASETIEIIDYFPGDYKSKGRIIVSIFLTAELKELGISMTEKSALHDNISKLVDPTSVSYLSDMGMKEINKYSYGGHERLLQWFDDRPRTVENFLILYKRYLANAISEKW